MTKDWHDWHRHYDDPGSDLSARLETVRRDLKAVLDARGDRPGALISICAGDGRDALPVLAAAHRQVSATLIEYDPGLADRARATADELGLSGVEVRTADAGELSSYSDLPAADVFMACGVFGNMTDADMTAVVDALPHLIGPDAVVIWTRGPLKENDPSSYDGHPADVVRSTFDERSFEEVSFTRPGDGFSVGVHRFVGTPQSRRPEGQLFTFVR